MNTNDCPESQGLYLHTTTKKPPSIDVYSVSF